MGLFNRKQLAALEETTPGTFNSSVLSATYAQFLPIDPVANFDFPTYDRRIQRASLTKAPPLAGMQRGTVSFAHELTGHSDGSTTPKWDIFLRACGFAKRTLYKITIGAVTGGPFRHGETITQGTSNATAKVFLDTYTGTTTLYVHTISGTPDNSHTWTGGTSAATATASTTETACGFGWEPVDFPTQTVTYSTTPSPDLAAGDIFSGSVTGAIGVVESVNTSTKVAQVRIHNAKAFTTSDTLARVSPDTDTLGACAAATWNDVPSLSLAMYDDGELKKFLGARGSVSFSGRIGEVAMMRFSFTCGYSGLADSQNLATPSTPYKTPPVLLGVGAYLGTEGTTPSYIPRFTAFELDIANQLAYRESQAASSGILETMIADRNPRGSIDPEVDLEASYPFLTNWRDNVIGSLRLTVGSSVGNKFIIGAPGLRATGATNSQRDNISTYDYSFALTGGQMSNASNAIGERNELVLAYITA